MNIDTTLVEKPIKKKMLEVSKETHLRVKKLALEHETTIEKIMIELLENYGV